MSSSFSSALAKLDGTLEVVLQQLDFLEAGLEVNEPELSESLKDACHHSAMLRELICAEEPDAKWDDRAALVRVIAQLEAAAKARLDQQRRTKLVELANELDAGRVQHRFEARTKTLNGMRLDAVRQLRTEAAVSEQSKDLPGPNAGDWLNWACNLDDEQDAPILARLRRDFVALERFTAEMDVGYWVPGQRIPEDPAPPPPRPVAPAPKSSASVRTRRQKPSEDVRAQVQTAPANGNHAEAVSLCYEGPSNAGAEHGEDHPRDQAATPAAAPATALASGASLMEAIAAAPHEKYCDTCGSSFPAEFRVCPFDEAELRVIEDATEEDTPGEAPVISGTEPETSETPVEQPSSEAREDLAGFDQPVVRKRPVMAWAGAAALVVLGVLVAVIYHLHAGSGRKPGQGAASVDAQVAAASQNPETSLASTPQMEAPQPAGSEPPSPQAAPTAAALLHKQPLEGAQDKILLSLENCDRVTPGGIECWGYVSNLGNESSRVSLDRADVVDGKGNNFTVDKKGQLSFATGHSLDVAAGSRVKYTVKVPDADHAARTLTLYVDLSTPPSLEYTFRDVPVAN